MRRHVLWMVLSIGFVTGTGGHLAFAQTTIEFIAPQGPDGDTGIASGPNGDSVIFTGRATSFTPLGGCGYAGDYPVHTALALDPGAGDRPMRLIGVIGTSSTDPIHPGTRLRNLEIVTNCTGLDDASWTKYRGEEC